MVTRILTLVIFSMFLMNCSANRHNDFTCAGAPNGASCMDSMTILSITDDPILQKRFQRALDQAIEDEGSGNFNPYEVLDRVRSAHYKSNEYVMTTAPPINEPQPVLEAPKVNRIWISPFVDRKGDLHMPGLIFTETSTYKWGIGEAEIKDTKHQTPIVIIDR